jgi:CBS domain-containing protein
VEEEKMLRLSDIMTPDVITVSPEHTLREAMDVFVAQHISGAPVVEGSRVLGVVSTTDLLALAAAIPGTPTVRDTRAAIEPEESGEDEESGNEPPASFFTDMWDDAGADVVARTEHSGSPEWNALEEHTVSEAMNTRVWSLPPEMDVPRAAERMRELAVHRVLVMDDDKLVGIVTTTDIANAVAEHNLAERRFIFGKPQVRADGSWW